MDYQQVKKNFAVKFRASEFRENIAMIVNETFRLKMRKEGLDPT